jgi:hypothetical protein
LGAILPALVCLKMSGLLRGGRFIAEVKYMTRDAE